MLLRKKRVTSDTHKKEKLLLYTYDMSGGIAFKKLELNSKDGVFISIFFSITNQYFQHGVKSSALQVSGNYFSANASKEEVTQKSLQLC